MGLAEFFCPTAVNAALTLADQLFCTLAGWCPLCFLLSRLLPSPGAQTGEGFTTHHQAHFSAGPGVIVCLGKDQEIPLDSDLPASLFGWPVL